MAKKIETNELKLQRIYDAPVKLVWEAWTDPKQAAKWWGPRGFTITTHSKDLRPGGTWNYIMHGPDGTDYPNIATYYEVEKYSKLVYDHGATETTPPLFRVTVTFKEVNGKTKMDMTMTLKSVEAAQQIKKFIKQAGGNATWDRLAEYLGETEGKNRFFINRTFDTPIETMFKMWTDPSHIAKWLPPAGMSMEYKNVDVREGGTSFYKMTNGKDVTMYGKIKYLEISPVTRLVYTQMFCDENEKISRHPHAPIWPETMKTIVTFTPESADETRVTIQWEPGPEATKEEIDFFMQARGGMTQGWTGSFDKLEELLEK